VSDSIASISCEFVVQQVVRLAVRLADCCMQLVVDLLWTCCATSCTTDPQQIDVMEHSVCSIISICCGSVVQLAVQHVVQRIDNESKLMESNTCEATKVMTKTQNLAKKMVRGVINQRNAFRV